uniref:Uncharacterized protein n=1 Tax=Meloidogyne javanica TaxID=6303 RepID=A0A915LFP9_MELJA
MNTGSRIDVMIRITKYYVWLYISINQHENILHKFWPEKWWEGKFFNESEVDIDISGDFAIFTPVYIKPINDEEFNELADIFYYINKMPYSFVTEEIISNEVHNKFIFMFEKLESKTFNNTLFQQGELFDLKSYGIILCFEADVPKAKDMTTHQFEINLLHDSSETYPDCEKY